MLSERHQEFARYYYHTEYKLKQTFIHMRGIRVRRLDVDYMEGIHPIDTELLYYMKEYEVIEVNTTGAPD